MVEKTWGASLLNGEMGCYSRTPSCLVVLVDFSSFLFYFYKHFVISVFLVKYNNFSSNLFISIFLVKYKNVFSNFYNNSFRFHFIYFNLFIVTFLLRFWGTVKGIKETYFFRLIRSLIFDTILVWKHFNFMARMYTILIVMYVEVKFQKTRTKFREYQNSVFCVFKNYYKKQFKKNRN